MSDSFKFYMGRLSACPSYGFQSGHEIIQTITRCAFWDSTLTHRGWIPSLVVCTMAEEREGYTMMSYEGVFDFYRDRIASCPQYGFESGHEILATITRCAFWDSMLTDEEFNSIINLAEQCHIKMLEDNYNAGWEHE